LWNSVPAPRARVRLDPSSTYIRRRRSSRQARSLGAKSNKGAGAGGPRGLASPPTTYPGREFREQLAGQYLISLGVGERDSSPTLRRGNMR
jgi:hypothetical protein